ncbi:MAG: HAD-IIA family hydrolase [Anaerolineae bacterium]
MQNNADKLRPIENLIIDMDGVLYRGHEAIPGLREFFALLRARSIGFILATNNSTRTAQQYVDKLAQMGVEVALSEILTSSQATAMYLETLAPPGTKVYVIGEEGLETAVRERGYIISGDGAEFVVVGMDRRLSYEKLKVATLLIRRGARFIGSNPDKTLPTEEGLIPGAGAMLAALEASTGIAPTIVGKPERTIFELALVKLGGSKEDTAIVGDRLETDVLGGYNAGLMTILVLSGAATRQDVDSAPVKPDLVFEDVRHLYEVWRQL